ncbi:hypothetical protein F5J12DRAFT_786086 [Pisolithus orientalis]|uniref:uncharacterized protein n=1 Tax=Pisolithus orientalis TaxID=936130 RepID=UPI002224D02F|nr:uncharacterized protein F5J12DRAFT_786086 [Pisolithus orientalis]KAI5993100.1 hypothetical protein F5J12DRAFT_786086 [Pisolithus orientalis]
MKARFQEEAYHCPNALSPKRRADIWNHLHLLREPLWESIKASPQAWQMDKSYFCNNAELKGTINLSPTWFQQGHWPQNGFLEASWLLKSRMENTSTREWVNQMSDTNALLSAILEVVICLGEQSEQWVDSDMSSILSIWSSTYSSMSMMVDQATCYHRDSCNWRTVDLKLQPLMICWLLNFGWVVLPRFCKWVGALTS